MGTGSRSLSLDRWLLLAATALALLAALTALAFSVAIAWITFYDAPYWDHWAFADRDQFFANLGVRNNEHPMLLAEGFFWLDDRLVSGTGRFLQTLTILCLAAQAALFGWLALKAGGRWMGLAGLSVAAAFVFNAFGFETIIWPFELTLALAFTSALACFAFLAAYAASNSRLMLALAIVFSIISPLCFANGVLTPTLAAVMAALLQRRRVVLAFSGIALLAWFEQISISSQAARNAAFDIGAMIAHFLVQIGAAMGFAAGYLQKFGFGMPMQPTAMAAGAFAAATSGAALAWIGLKRRRDPVMIALAAVILFALATAGLTAIGRHDMGVEQALSSRYNVNAGLLWSALAVVGFSAAKDAPVRWRRLTIWAAPLAAMTLVVVSLAARPVLANLTLRHRGAMAGMTALVAGAPDWTSIGQLSDNPMKAAIISLKLRENRTFMYAAASARRSGQNLTTEEMALPACDGSRWRTHRQDLYRTVWGEFPRTAQTAGARHILIADDAGKIVGYGHLARRVSDLNPLARTDGRHVDWGGHVQIGAGPGLTAWLADDDRVRCSLGTGGEG